MQNTIIAYKLNQTTINMLENITSKVSKDIVEYADIVLALDDNKMLDTYTFENYTVTKNNEFAYSAAKAVVKLQGVAYNPLFIYGENKLEQTHLLYAIKNEVMKNENIKILYSTYETFISSYKANKLNLKNTYKGLDFLLIDNFQLFSEKYTVQNELITIFKQLLKNNKQIVILSDVELNKLDLLEELKTQINIGLFADIQK